MPFAAAKKTEGVAMVELVPYYLTAEQAAEVAGIGVKEVMRYLNSADPPAYLRVGATGKRIEHASWQAYLERKQEVRMP